MSTEPLDLINVIAAVVVTAVPLSEAPKGSHLGEQVALPGGYDQIRGSVHGNSATQKPPAVPAVGSKSWKTVAGYPGYEVSTAGQVRRASTGKLLKPRIAKTQSFVTLSAVDGKRETVYVKTAVLLAHQPQYPPGAPIRQLDGDATDCHLFNLSWLDGDLRQWVTSLDGDAVVAAQLDPKGRRRAFGWCSAGHALSTTGKPDANTAMWGFSQRICRTCTSEADPTVSRWHRTPAPRYSYGHHGVAAAPPRCLLSSVVRDWRRAM
jgi:hypothetical protein